MSRTAPAIKRNLGTINKHYLALKFRRDQERRVFVFDAELDNQIASVRNQIVELQAKLRKGGELQHA